MVRAFPPLAFDKLGYYVYIYVDPRSDEVFYVGKGVRNRAFSHLEDPGPSAKVARIAEIRRGGLEPIIEILVHGLRDEDTALKIESAVIDLLGKSRLTNLARGYQSTEYGRMSVKEIAIMYGAEPGIITHPVLLIRINQLFRPDLSEAQLYDVTRGFWRLGERRSGAKYALAVYEGVVREVYEIESWHPAGSTLRARYPEEKIDPTRWEFVGQRANDPVRSAYIHADVRSYLPKGAQSPITYVNC